MAKRQASIRTIRAYDVRESDQGYRVLIDRLWPRGVSKETLDLDLWAKELAPSTELRKWFGHEPAKWSEFRRRYTRELSDREDAGRQLVHQAGNQPILLIYAAKDESHNHALVLKEFLEECCA